jgi:AAA family ATP:ADP antiporter
MNKIRRIATFFNIQPGEERLIGLLILFYFVLALAFVFIQSMAFGMFLAEYGPQSLPYSYIAIAVFASLAAVLYIKLGERVSFSKALMLNLASLGACSFLAWLGLKSSFSHSVSFILPLLFQIVINLGNLVVWPLAGRLFNFQQAKRLFPLLGVGLWLANTLGGLLVAPLVAWMGAANLLLLAIASIGLALLVLRVIVNTYLRQAVPTAQTRRTASTKKGSGGLLNNRYVLLIFSYIILWWVAFFFLDNIFSDRAAAQFPNVNQLTAFMGQLISVTGIVALVFSIFLNGRIIGRFGLRYGLAGMPLLVTFTLGSLAISGSLGGTLAIVFALGVLAKLINVAFGFSLSQSANAIVYQSLPDTVRVRVQATAEGIVQPIAIGLAGISLLALTAGLKFDYLGLSYVFLGLAAVWLIVIFLLSGGYVDALTQAITKRRLGESPAVLADPACIALLESRLQDPHPGVALYALTKLDDLDSKSAAKALPDLIQHLAPEVRREAFSRIEKLKLRAGLGAVRNQLTVEKAPPVKEAGLRALGAIADSDSLSQLLDPLDGTEAHSLRGALIGLLKYQDEPAAEKTLDQLLLSSSTTDRRLAAQVLGEVDRTQFREMHQNLLCDPDPGVRIEAIQSAGKSRQPVLYPLLINACDSPETSRAATLALTNLGEEVYPEIETAFSQPNAPRQRLMSLAAALGRIGGMRSQALLRSQIGSPDGELRLQILNALSQCHYHTKDLSEIYAAIKPEIQELAWICAAQVDLEVTEKAALLAAALRKFVAQTRERVLLLLSFAFDTNSILQAREAWLSGTASQLAYALEIVDTQLPTEWKPMIIPLLEDLSPEGRLRRLASIFPQDRQTREDHLRALICESSGQQFLTWTRACAIYTAVQLSTRSLQDAIQNASTQSDELVRNTAGWALAQLSGEAQKGKNAMLSTIEKVLILKSVDMFSQTPDEVLADVANLLEEMEISEGETIFKKGDLGDSMYVIVDGKVGVYDGGRLLNYLGEHDVFGEMALLDPEPRLASVRAVEPTRLFRLDQSPFYQLMAERPEVATGIIRVLTRHLRNRVRDISQLDARIKELESTNQLK